MKITIIRSLAILGLSVFGLLRVQAQVCGADHRRSVIEEQLPVAKEMQKQLDEQIRKRGIQRYLQTLGIQTSDLRSGGTYQGPIYEIPVVVHVIESNADSLSHLKRTDEQIRTWIDNCNKMFATTYGNGYFAEGEGKHGGTVIPFRLVLAKRTSSCQATTGIIRYNGSSLPGYDHGGIKFDKTYTDSCITTDQMRKLAPHWADGHYYNIYVVTGFDGDKTKSGLMGWATFPSTTWSLYETVMKATVVTNPDDNTLAHEIGHALGLDHPFVGATITPDQNETVEAKHCPANNDCTKDNDQICDTEPTANLLNVSPMPTDTTINPCTGLPYEGIQYNIMNYAAVKRKFTVGQRERALAQFFTFKGALVNSLGATEPDAASSIDLSLSPATCNPSGIKNPGFSVTMSHIRLNDINHVGNDYASATNFYADHTTNNCLSKSYTDISASEESTITITTSQVNPGYYKVWIDFNNDGIFSESPNDGEVICDKNSTKGEVLTITFTPPGNAVKNTYLRMRVRGDWTEGQACDTLLYGRVEDFAVRIVDAYSSAVSSETAPREVVVFEKSSNTILALNTVDTVFGYYEIFDLQGKLLQKGTSSSNRIRLNMTLPSGAYLVKYKGKTIKINT